MNIIIWLVAGGLLGWATSAILRTQEGVLLNIGVGIVGAVLGGWLLSPLDGVTIINQRHFSFRGLFVSFVGAVILLGIVYFVRRSALRPSGPPI